MDQSVLINLIWGLVILGVFAIIFDRTAAFRHGRDGTSLDVNEKKQPEKNKELL